MVRAVFALTIAALVAGCGPLYGPDPAGTPAAAWSRLAGARDLDGAPVGASPSQATIAIVFASWCGNCRAELGELVALLGRRGDARVLGVNFRRHEEYDRRGDSAAVRAFVRHEAPWLRVVPGDEAMWRAFGSPGKIPSVYVFDRGGQLVAVYDGAQRDAPDAAELAALLDRL